MTENIKREIEALTEKVGEKLLAIASTDTKDRVGDIVKVDGWDLKNFKKNPILLFAHKYDEPPIGYAKNIKIEKDRLVFEPIFHEITQLAREIKAMFMAEPPIMRAWSVGFIPLQFDEEDRHIISKQELLEISAVPVPANAEALMLAAKSYSPDDEKEIVKWLDKMNKECPKCDKDLEEITDTKPYPNEHSCRLNSPDKYDRFARKNCEIKHDDKCIDVIYGIKENKAEIQAFRYDKEIWTADSAKSHCQSHDGSFEPASEKQEKKEYEYKVFQIKGAVSEELKKDEIQKMKWNKISPVLQIIDAFFYKYITDERVPINDFKILLSETIGLLSELLSERKDIIAQIKEGRVLSGKTLEAIDNAVVSMKNAISVLKDLRQLANKPSDDGEDKSFQGRREEAHKSRKNRIIVRALQNVDKIVNELLRDYKKDL